MKSTHGGVDSYRMYINGEFVDSKGGGTIDVASPTNEEVLFTVPNGTTDDAQLALETAKAAQPAWAAMPAVERGNILARFADLIRENRERLAKILTQEMGKTYSLALGEVDVSADFINFPAQAARRIEGDILPSDLPGEHIMIHKVPYGVTVGIAAWNFPLALSCRKIGPALTTGNVMVVKPPSVTPVAVLALGELAEQAGIPKGVLNLVTGGGSTMGEELVTNPITRLVTMTGSSQTGQEIFRKAADRLIAVRLELGGKAPFILLADGDVDKAVDAAVVSRHLNSGQVCTCPERFYIHDAVYDEFLQKYSAAVAKLKIGDPMDETTDIGPKVNAHETSQLEQIVDKAVAQGAKLVVGGKRPDGEQFAKGHWYEPTILTECTNEMEVMQEEVFGVVSPIMRIGSYEEALALANDCKYGLAAFLFTNDVRLIQRAVLELEFGEIYVNRPMGEQRQGFHNGYKLSGTGGEDGKYGLENYLEKKTMYVNFSG
ncbi:lactaldehyde dehydrogenase / glycolaldehyde dehydrogenase [Neorhodopirellula lusitana]|uniref:Lactaldehyde dehydrogenase / glycolaldehyde dehydrogenase n=1 Tax=Neorhodopirellula lusitana TaxID=445327 RepID=A0ABY1Q9Y3_9BACT|nr:aldehyde dehydrogenase [Neorhodopirellula lusitana]SMP63674.1 lactaldehyde dehydrogenase / glycolaldehyde dehydrogenase [Neorhodopirellula lusitana]